MKKVIWLLFLLALPLAVSGQGREYVGYIYKPVLMGQKLPNGVVDAGGSIVGDPFGAELWGVAHMNKGKAHMLWLERSVEVTSQGVSKWRVVDTLWFPSLRANEDLIIAEGMCTVRGQPVQGLAVLAAFDRRKGSYRVVKAWIADINAGQFMARPTKGIDCEYGEP